MIEELTIVDIGAGGDGIGHSEDGRTIFVSFTVTGDCVLAAVDAEGRGKVKEVLERSPHRSEPPCPHFGICGGCSLQHLEHGFYQSFKKDQVLSALQKEGVPMPERIDSVFVPAGTRRRANFAARIVNGKAIIGFHERKSATIRSTPDCLLITEDVRRIMNGLRAFLPAIVGDGKKMDVLIQCIDGQAEVGLTGTLAPGWEAQQTLSDALRTLDLSRISLRARDYESYEILLEAKGFYKAFDSFLINLAPGAFLQPSDDGERALIDCVMRGAGDAACVADLFCGNGTFTGPLMKGREKVMAADFAPDAIAALQKAGVDAHVRNLFKSPMSAEELKGYDCVVLDPPRAGAQAQAQCLSFSDVKRVVYVSCNPQSFARDVAILKEGDFRIAELTVVDQFIWSSHTELVAVLTR